MDFSIVELLDEAKSRQWLRAHFSELESNEIDYNIVTIIPPASVMDVKLSNNQAALATRYFIILPIVYNNADF
jgi:hypothetical protein